MMSKLNYKFEDDGSKFLKIKKLSARLLFLCKELQFIKDHLNFQIRNLYAKKMIKLSERIPGFILSLFVILILPGNNLSAVDIDKNISALRLSGFLRTRMIHTSSRGKFPDRFPGSDTYNHVNFQDFFLRNRLSLVPNNILGIHTVFDIASVFGEDKFSLGGEDISLITRDAYFSLNLQNRIKFTGGLQPFLLPGGYILARDGAGFKVEQQLQGIALKWYAAWVRAFDGSRRTFGDAIPAKPNIWNQDNIVYAGFAYNPVYEYLLETYMVYENDTFTNGSVTDNFAADSRRAELFWLGIHNQWVSNLMVFKIAGIWNTGKTEFWNSQTVAFDTRSVNAFLLSSAAGYQYEGYLISFLFEGASGSAGNRNHGGSFQAIQNSVGFSMILVDNFGGISYTGFSTTAWQGLYGTGFEIEKQFLQDLNLSAKLLHFRTTSQLGVQNQKSSFLGHEMNFTAKYNLYEFARLQLNSAILLPGGAWQSVIQDHRKSAIWEFMLGLTVSY